MKKKISIVTPCFNEEENIQELYRRVTKVLTDYTDKYEYELIFIDNDSQDHTQTLIKSICSKDHRVKLIINSRNFGHIRSPVHGMLQANGDCVILIFCDLQDPPETIHKFIEKWENGADAVLGIKSASNESALMFLIRKIYYRTIDFLSEIKLQKDFNGFGLFDRKIIEALRIFNDPYPYLRGLILEAGYNIEHVKYVHQSRKRGITKNNFFTLYDIAMLGITSHSKVPLRLVTLSGFAMASVSLVAAMTYLVYKLAYWDGFKLGMAPIVIGLFMFASIQLLATGLIGEYIGFIYTKLQHRPLVLEKERINFKPQESANFDDTHLDRGKALDPLKAEKPYSHSH